MIFRWTVSTGFTILSPTYTLPRVSSTTAPLLFRCAYIHHLILSLSTIPILIRTPCNSDKLGWQRQVNAAAIDRPPSPLRPLPPCTAAHHAPPVCHVPFSHPVRCPRSPPAHPPMQLLARPSTRLTVAILPSFPIHPRFYRQPTIVYSFTSQLNIFKEKKAPR